MTISEEDLRGLSAVERETLLAAEQDDEDGDIAHELGISADAPRNARSEAANDADAGDEAETDAEDEAAAAAAAVAEAAKGEGEGAAANDEDGDLPGEQIAQRSTPDDAAEQRKTLRAEKAEGMQKLLDGEITQAEYQEIEDRVQDKLDALLRAEATDSATAKIEHDSMLATYNVDLRATIKLGQAAGLDYKGDEKLAEQFNRAVVMFSKSLAEQGIYDTPANNLANSKQALQEAHAFMLVRHGKQASAAAAPAAAKTKAEARPAPDRSKLGVTLAAVPVASDARITSEFAHLDAFDPKDIAGYERALARMTPEQQERYLGAA